MDTRLRLATPDCYSGKERKLMTPRIDPTARIPSTGGRVSTQGASAARQEGWGAAPRSVSGQARSPPPNLLCVRAGALCSVPRALCPPLPP